MPVEAQAGEKMRRGCDCAQSVTATGAMLIGHKPGLTCPPGSAPNRSRLACAPRTSPLNTNCVKESSIVMQIRVHSRADRPRAPIWLAPTSCGSILLK
jgi:hypothetical protein